MKNPWIAATCVSSAAFWALLNHRQVVASPVVPEGGSQTQVVQTGNEFTITGGVTAGDGRSLFYSFEQLGLSAGQIANFLSQPHIESILGRVVGGDASYVNGLLQVSGSAANLYLINPNGILFGPNAQLDLSGSFAAITASGVQFENGIFDAIAANDYSQLAGSPVGYVFAVDEAGAIVNAGDLAVAPGESITLVGGQVISTGTLTAPGGEITIAAIPEASLVRISHPDMLLNLELATLPEGTTPSATLTPLSLPALLTGAGAEVATGLTVQPDGTIALFNTGTVIPHDAGTAIATGNLDVSGAVGGDVAVVGDRVALLDAIVNASGENGAGNVRLGGDFQGIETLPGSQLTYIDADTTIAAIAGITGNGGRVILWSDGTTLFYGEIAADGGSLSGDGGFVEVSGQQALVYRGTVQAIAPNGQIGTLLLDPTDVIIRNGSADGDDSDGSAFQLTEFNFAATDPIPTIIYESELESSPGNIDLGIRASNDIILEDLADDALTFFTDPGTPGSITFEAGNEFRVVDPSDVIVAPLRSLTITANAIITGDINTSAGSSSDNGGNVNLVAVGAIATGDINTLGEVSGDITLAGSSIQSGRMIAGGGFLNDSRVELTSTSGDIVVDTISTGGGGLAVDAARRFQVVDSFDAGVRITLNSATDAALIDFLMKGDPQPLIDAGLVDTSNQILFSIPTSILVSPDTGGGPIVIRHGGAAGTLSDGNIIIEGTGTFPDIQFVFGPNDDHTIAIDPGIPDASFTGFTTLFPAGTFPDGASGTTGAILRGQGDATLVTSFQNQPFVPIDPGDPGSPGDPGDPGGNPGGNPFPGGDPGGDGGTRGGGGGTEGDGGEGAKTAGTVAELENLSDEDETAVSEIDAAASDSALTVSETASQACRSVVVSRDGGTVEVATVCEPEADNESQVD